MWGVGLRKEYVVTEITASSDGSPYVFVSLKDPEDIGGPQRSPFAQSAATFRSMDDMFKNLGQLISRQMMKGFTTVIKLSLDKYEKLDIKVGDRIALEINKIQVGIP